MGHECQVQRARWRRRGGQPGLGWLGLSGPKLGHVSGGADARVLADWVMLTAPRKGWPARRSGPSFMGARCAT
eukprot:scaffold18187_cov109-Isochrysis_galbana.AAC.2